ncbi:MAG: LytTR family DNA-binding domain-containing protein [Bacteroidia bacterium]|nr:LytTR family DNA-binding domain-containing protein [Bacteroidia bacterium]
MAFFDIELADGKSFEILKRTTTAFPVVFTTAYDEYAIQAFKFNSIDYLLKPIDKDDLTSAIRKYEQHSRQFNQDGLTELLKQLQPATSYKERFLVKSGTKLHAISTEDIAYFYAADKLVYLITFSGARFIADYTIEQLLPLLNPSLFHQANRHTIVNVSSIKNIHIYFNGKLKLDLNPPTQDEVIVSRERAGNFKNWLDR